MDFQVEIKMDLYVGGAFRHKYLSKLKIPQGDKMSKKFPELTEFQVWKQKDYHYFNAIYNGFWWGGLISYIKEKKMVCTD